MRPAVYVLATTLAALALAAPASAYTLGVGDAAQFPAGDSQKLGATAYRVVIDPALPLESYTPRILAHRAVGQEPQLVIGGTGTQNHASSRGVVRAAVAAAKRWPSAYSISVVNEPNEAGMSVCEYARTYVAAYRSLKAVGVKRILFGEFSPNNTLGWLHATLTKCPKASKALRGKVGRVAWHYSVDDGAAIVEMTKRITGHTPKLYVTEAGFLVSFQGVYKTPAAADLGGLRYWRHALKLAAGFDEIVAWDLHAIGTTSAWDSSLVDGSGRERPAFGLIARAQR